MANSLRLLRLYTLIVLATVCIPVCADELDQELTRDLLPLLKTYCLDCHDQNAAEGDVSLEPFPSAKSIQKERDLWLRALRQVEAGVMPPPDGKAMNQGTRTQFANVLDKIVNSVDCQAQINPGKVTLRRLNRSEYRNTIRDLTSIDYEPAKNFPGDDVGYGFDNIGDVMSLPPILLEKYLQAAEEIMDQAIKAPAPAKLLNLEFTGETLDGGKQFSRDNGAVGMYSNGEVHKDVTLPFSGEFQLTVSAYGDQGGGEPCRMEVRVNDKRVRVVNVPSEDIAEYKIPLRLGVGKRRISLLFINDYYVPRSVDRNLYIAHVSLSGRSTRSDIVLESDLPASHKGLLFVRPGKGVTADDASSAVIQKFASRAFRRPVTTQELVKLTAIARSVRNDGGSFEESIQVAFQAILISPHFLFRYEQQQEANADGTYPPLSEFELASRISYFMWSSMPDDRLLKHAWNGTLRRPEVLASEVRRLLSDRRAVLMIDNFASQWLQLRNLKESEPDKQLFPSFDDEIRALMKRETLTFFAAVVRYDRPVTALLDGKFTYLNEKLAKFYGIDGVKGENFQLVRFRNSRRAGLLTQASVLTVTSNPTRTSPVKRGKWILDNLLGTPPPPAPANVPELERGQLHGTLRERMEQHRSDPACASCHKLMDPLGFALENFDPVGQWRSTDGRDPIDASGELPDGSKFDGIDELRSLLLERKRDQFVRCLTEKMLIFAIGRGLEHYDKCAVDEIVARLKSNNYRFSELIVGIVESDPFQRQGVRLQDDG